MAFRIFCWSTGIKALNAIVLASAAAALCGCIRTPVRRAESPTTAEQNDFQLPAHHFIYRGMDKSAVLNLVGPPNEVEKQEEPPEREDWYYDFGVVVLEAGKVEYKYPPSKAARD